ncbi:MAG: O-antigen translocase [Sphingomicrobium sp.]
MKDQHSSSVRRIVVSTAILGTSSFVNVLVGAVRMKAAALILGATGVGLVGLVQNFMLTAAAFLGLGLEQAAPRQIGKARASGAADERTARAALLLTTLGAAALGGVAVWLSREVVARDLFGDPSLSRPLGWMSIGTALTIAASSQTALLVGLGRIKDVARVSIVSALVGTAAALLSLYLWGNRAVIPFVLAAPVAAFFVGGYFTSRLPKAGRAGSGRSRLGSESVSLATLGVSMTLAAALANAAQLAVRALINHGHGLAELGYFQAAWAISTMYLAMVLQAMGVDYFPRLTAVGEDHSKANQLINEQTFVALTLGGPVILLTLGICPWVLQLLYSSEFRQAAGLLRWQLFGDVLRLASWPLGYMLLATGSRGTFLLVETTACLIFVVLSALLLPSLSIEAVGVAFVCMYAIHLPMTFAAVTRLSGFRWTSDVLRRFSILLVLAGGTLAMARADESLAAVAAAPLSAILFVVWGRNLVKLVTAPGRTGDAFDR